MTISLHAPTDVTLGGEIKQPSIDEIEPHNAELIQGLQNLCSSTKVKSTTNLSAAAAFFRKRTEHNSESSMRQQGSSSNSTPK